MTDDKILEIKLRRAGLLLSPPRLIQIAVIAGFLIFAVVYQSQSAPSIQMIASAVSMSMLFILLVCFADAPKSLLLEENKFSYTKREYLSSTGFVRRRGVPTSVTYTVTRVEEIELLQNPIEKIFDTGHIKFKGYTTFECSEAYADSVRPPKVHRVYGIPHFSRAKREIENYIDKYVKNKAE